MLIAEALDALITCGWWLIGWILVGAAVLTVVLLAGSAVGAWAVRGVWRGVAGAWRARPQSYPSVNSLRPSTPLPRRSPSPDPNRPPTAAP